MAASYAWGVALFALPTTLGLAGEIYAGAFGTAAGVAGEPAFWLLAVAYLPVVLAVFVVFLALLTFVVALLWHPLVVLAVGVGKGSGFGATFRVLTYTSVTTRSALSCRSWEPSSWCSSASSSVG